MLDLEPILLVGAGGHAKSCIDVIEQEGRFSIEGLIGLENEVGNQILGYPVVGTDKNFPTLLQNNKNILITIGQIKSPELRINLYEQLKKYNCNFPTVVSPSAYISKHAVLGEGTIVMHGAIINAGAVVGDNCIINSQALIEHDVTISAHCHIATAVAINGGVNIGQGTFIGSNSSIRQNISIEENSLIGMGQQVLSDCTAGTQIPKLKG